MFLRAAARRAQPCVRSTPVPTSSRLLATTCSPQASHASSSDDLAFPSTKNPTPFDIFHLDPKDSAQLTPAALRAKFYRLARIYHPDASPSPSSAKGKGRASDSSDKFKQIVDAYELLRNPSRRSVYLRTGYGWTGPRRAPDGPDLSGGYDFRRGRPMRHTEARGPYPSAAWDWADPHNPHFRPGQPSAEGGGGGGVSAAATGWNSRGNVTTNGTVIIVLVSLMMLFTPLSAWVVVPADLMPRNSLAASGISDEQWEAMKVGGRNGRHREAAMALDTARKEARAGGAAKRDAIKRRVRQIESERAYDRAIEVDSISRAELGTGHLLPPPADKAPPP